MPEIGLFGSEGGAPTHGVPTLSVSKVSRFYSILAFSARNRKELTATAKMIRRPTMTS